MAVNACGNGSAKTLFVTHGGTGGGIPRMSNPINILDTKIYPNPVTNTINVKVNTELSKTKVLVTLYDLLGRQILQVDVLDSVAALNVEDIPSGNYILKLAYNDEVETHQIIIE
jgi:hypothetical protein